MPRAEAHRAVALKAIANWATKEAKAHLGKLRAGQDWRVTARVTGRATRGEQVFPVDYAVDTSVHVAPPKGSAVGPSADTVLAKVLAPFGPKSQADMIDALVSGPAPTDEQLREARQVLAQLRKTHAGVTPMVHCDHAPD